MVYVTVTVFRLTVGTAEVAVPPFTTTVGTVTVGTAEVALPPSQPLPAR